MSVARPILESIEAEFARYEKLMERTIGQLSEEELVARASPESLSIAMIVWHLSGNLRSRFTDFLTADGEKAWRDRDTEFEPRSPGRQEIVEKWEEGRSVLRAALSELTDDDLARSVRIRGEPHTVSRALARALAHTSYHVGQATYIGKVLRGAEWSYLTVPPGQPVFPFEDAQDSPEGPK